MSVTFRHRRFVNRAPCVLLLLAAALALGSCAANKAFTTGQQLLATGQYEEGLNKLKQAVDEDPKNGEYRTYYYRQREIAINLLLAQADDARMKGEADVAEGTFRRVITIDPNNVRAKTGLDRVQMDRRHKIAIVEAGLLLKAGNADAAADKIRVVLAENPASRDARALQRQIDEQRAKNAAASPLMKSAMTKPMSLEFREANIRSIFEVIARVAGINFVFDKDVRPDLKATILVQNESIDEIVKTLLVTNQLEKKVLNPRTILIYPNTPAKAKDYQELVVKSFYLTNADAKQAFNLLKTILKIRDVYIDEKLSLLVIRDTAEMVRLAEKLIVNQDLAEPEVLLEVEVTEIKRSRLTDLGIQFPNQFSVLNYATTTTTTTNAGTVVAASPTVTTNPLTVDTLKNLTGAQIGISPVVANLRSESSDVNLLANPRIRVKNREKAKIHIGDRVPVITTTSTANVGVSQSVSYLEIGLRLEVEPTVNLDDEVGIKIGLEVSNIVREIASSTGSLTYQIGTRSASTMLRLKDGETQALAGLINDEDRKSANKVPGLGDLPIIGRLFSDTRTDSTKTEIILLITPHVVRNLVRPDAAYTEFNSGTESFAGSGAPAGALAGGSAPAPAPSQPVGAPSQPLAPAPSAPTVQPGQSPSPFRTGP